MGCLLHRSEIHTIDAIGKNPQTNVTDLSNYLGITKSALLPMIDKLIKKLILKTVLSKRDTPVALNLTDNDTYYKSWEKVINAGAKQILPVRIDLISCQRLIKIDDPSF